MQDRLRAEYPGLEIELIGVNETGFHSGNKSITSGRDLPWLQDEFAVAVWDAWAVDFRDVIILDGDNVHVETYNLTTYDLADTANFDALIDLLVDVANR